MEENKKQLKESNNVKLDVIVVGAQRCATTWFYSMYKKINYIENKRIFNN